MTEIIIFFVVQLNGHCHDREPLNCHEACMRHHQVSDSRQEIFLHCPMHLGFLRDERHADHAQNQHVQCSSE